MSFSTINYPDDIPKFLLLINLHFFQNVYAFAANPGESLVGKVSAQSVDGDVTYRIAEGGASLFHINATDGRIFYDGPLDKDPRNYELKVS